MDGEVRGTLDAATFELAQTIVREAGAAGLTVATAESCTGGLVASALTDVAGSSAVVLGGIVSYAVSVKESVLGVDPAITRDQRIGVVSAACAESMAEGARRVLCADIGVSTTGIAGPGGAEPGKPVGTVWFAVSSRLGTTSVTQCFEGDRKEVRDRAAQFALTLLSEAIRSL